MWVELTIILHDSSTHLDQGQAAKHQVKEVTHQQYGRRRRMNREIYKWL